MPFYYIIVIILVIFIFTSLFLNLLVSPITWIIIAALVIWSWVRKYLYAKQIEEYNKQFKQQTQEKKEQYYGSDDSQYYQNKTSNNNDVIDVNYTVVDEKEDD